jgi:hypothetical protein
MGKNSHFPNAPLSQNQNHATSGNPRDAHGHTGERAATASAPPEPKKPARAEQNQATVEEFGREGLGVAAKE